MDVIVATASGASYEKSRTSQSGLGLLVPKFLSNIKSEIWERSNMKSTRLHELISARDKAEEI
jgi:hypothetical protein